MSALETAAMPMIKGFLAGDEVRFDDERSLALSRWAVKTAMMYEYNHLDTVAFTTEQRTNFYETEMISPEIGVFVAPFQDANALRLGHTGGDLFDSDTREAIGHMGVTAIVLGTACVVVASVSDASLFRVLEARLRLDSPTWKVLFADWAEELTHNARPAFHPAVTHQDIDHLLSLI